MITNLPSAEDYFEIGEECLIQAYKNIFDVDNKLQNAEIAKNELWSYNRIVLNTSVILIFQGLESIMKSEICEISPLLLLGQKRKEWKTLPNSGNAEINDLVTISGDDLIRTYFAVLETSEKSIGYVEHFQVVRKFRNKVIHGLGLKELNPKIVISLILKSFNFLDEPGAFWESLSESLFQHPGFRSKNPFFEMEYRLQHKHLDYLESLVGLTELNKYFIKLIKIN